MSVLINNKRCDNASVCSCISECPTKAFYWDSNKKSVAVDNNLCINCRQCVIACEAGAVKVARDDEEYSKIKTEYDDDMMTKEELFQDRYGASIVDERFALDISDLEELIKNSNKQLLVEFYNDDEAKCLINSIKIEKIINKIGLKISYRKINLASVQQLKKYGVTTLPALVIIDNGRVVFNYNGFVDAKNEELILNKLDKFKISYNLVKRAI